MNIGDQVSLHLPREGDIELLNATVHKVDLDKEGKTGNLIFLVPGAEKLAKAPMLVCIWQSGQQVQMHKMNITRIQGGFMIHATVPFSAEPAKKKSAKKKSAKKPAKSKGK